LLKTPLDAELTASGLHSVAVKPLSNCTPAVGSSTTAFHIWTKLNIPTCTPKPPFHNIDNHDTIRKSIIALQERYLLWLNVTNGNTIRNEK
jgi:hypothetical protein